MLCRHARHAVGALALALVAAPAALAQPHAYITSLDDVVSVVDLRAMTVIDRIAVGADPSGVAIAMLSKRAYITNQSSSTVSVINTASGNQLATIDVGANPIALALEPDEQKLYVASFGDNAISVVDVRRREVMARVPTGAPPVGVVAAKETIFVTDFGTGLTAIDVATDTVLATIDLGTTGAGIAISPNGQRLYVALIATDKIAVLDSRSLRLVNRYQAGVGPLGIAVSPDGSALYVTNQLEDTVTKIDAATGATIALGVTEDRPTGIAVTADGRRVVIANQGSDSVTVLNAVDLRGMGTVPVGRTPIAFGQFIDGSGARRKP